MNHDEKDDLWDLLGKAKPAKVSPFFSRDVLRVIRSQPPEKSGVISWLLSRWGLVAAGACALLVAALFLQPRAEEAVESLDVLAHSVSSSPDYHVISNLDELLESQASSVWLDTSVY